jgi:biopolymer transport protein ExbB
MLDELFIRGGPVLFVLFFISFLIFFIFVNKYTFIYFDKSEWFTKKLDDFIKNNPPEIFSLKQVQKTYISELNRVSNTNIKLLDGLIGMCPMIGLLGTVYGMIEVFEVLSFLGTGNPRAMSSGVAKATIPTMASMVITIFSLYFRQDITGRIDKISKDIVITFKRRGYSY